MANIIKLGSILLDGVHRNPGSKYQLGQAISFGDGVDLQWIVVNGLLIADRPLLVDISWDDLNDQGLVFGKQVTINGQQFLCRSLQVGTEKGEPNEWDTALDATNEDDELWHWTAAFCWGQESVEASYRASRGCDSARRYYWDSSYHWNVFVGFRPVLEPLPSDNLISGIEVCAIGGQSILYGKLLEVTDYDAIIRLESNSILADTDSGTLYSRLDNCKIAIDYHRMTVQNM